MTDPKPGVAFTYRGLVWEPIDDAQWYSSAGSIELLHGLWWFEGDSWSTWQAACDWAIRMCPEARCGTCAHAADRDSVRSRQAGTRDGEVHCDARECIEPDSGFCHGWSAKL